jgi:5-dehydro-4-deoxyglucarate dehydratase
MHMDPKELAHTIGSGLLSFPVTHFAPDGSFNEASYRTHLAWLEEHKPAALFAAGGTGEYFSLTLAEFTHVVRAAVEETAGKMPILAGCGYGTAMAIEFAQAAEKAGADGLLLFPPYLVNADAEGLTRHVQAVCASTKLGVIVYNRDNAVVNEVTLAKMCDLCPNLVGFKDGVGDLELMTRIYLRMGDRLTYIGGLPTAETFALPYLQMGVTTYSSAIFNFLPKFAVDFYAAVRRQDHGHIAKEMRDFVLPYLDIRDRRKGYAVSIVKAGVRIAGHDCGPVRTPLSDLTTHESESLRMLIGARS